MIFAQSERLVLRRARPDDFEPMVACWADPEVSRWVPERADWRGFLTQLIADMQVKPPGETEPGGPWYQYVVERREDGALIGDLGAGFGLPGERQVELGYRIAPAFQRQGFAREAVAALIDHLIDAHAVHRFVAIVAAPNAASKRVLEALGFRREGHFRQSFWCGGEWVDDDYYALLADEWRPRQAG
jgi:RimJ/RimL family protein N-acetyltransferase